MARIRMEYPWVGERRRRRRRRYLLHDADIASQPPKIQLVDIHTIEDDAAVGRFIPPLEEGSDGALARTTAADERGGLGGGNGQIEAAEDGEMRA